MVVANSCNNYKSIVYENEKLEGKVVIIKKTFDKTRNIILEEALNKDSVNDGYYKKFDEGKIICIGSFKSGKKDGRWYYLDFLGDTVKIENWLEDERFGEQVSFYNHSLNRQAPHNIHRYSFVNPDENELFSMTFDWDGKVQKVIGSPLYLAYSKDSLMKGEIFTLMCFFGFPEQFDFKLIITEKDLRDSSIILYKEYGSDFISADIVNLDLGKKIMFKKDYSIQGVYSWKSNLKIFDKLDQTVFVNDSILLNIEVY